MNNNKIEKNNQITKEFFAEKVVALVEKVMTVKEKIKQLKEALMLDKLTVQNNETSEQQTLEKDCVPENINEPIFTPSESEENIIKTTTTTFIYPNDESDNLKSVTAFPVNTMTSKGGRKTPIRKPELEEKKPPKTRKPRPEYDYDDYDDERVVKGTKKKKGKDNQVEKKKIDFVVINKGYLTVRELSEKFGVPSSSIIKTLIELEGMGKSINDSVDSEVITFLADMYKINVEFKNIETSEEKLQQDQENLQDNESRPPIVTIMGHVDHGKTSVLDYIRNTHVTSLEAGGITQHIGAYSISKKGHAITFIDTPGHAAFTAMRERGANVTDIVVIVVAADDGIMPQTIEAINHSKNAGVEIIVAINKIDKKDANPDRILTQLSEHNLTPEIWGGNVPVVKVSAKTGEGIDELLETILVTAEIKELKANSQKLGTGTIIEAKLDKGAGPLATVIVQNGTLKVGDYIVAGTVTGKIRAMQDDKGKNIKQAGPSKAVQIQGLKEVPIAGDKLIAEKDEKLVKQVVAERLAKAREGMEKTINKSRSLADFTRRADSNIESIKDLNIVLKTDVQGSVGAIKTSLEELSTEEVVVTVVHGMAGSINESDVMLADTTNAIIIGFNVRPDSKAKQLADSKNVEIKIYRVIYDAIDEVANAIKGLETPKYAEEYLGKAEVREIFAISNVGNIAGCNVKDGKIVKNANVRVIRDNVVVADTMISSLKRLKDNVKEVVSGFDCGIGLENYNDFKVGDIIESFQMIKKRR